MNSTAYRAALARLGLTRLTAAEWLGVNEKTIRRWATGETPVPKRTAMILERDLADIDALIAVRRRLKDQ